MKAIRSLFQERIYSLLALIVLICIVASLSFPHQFPTFENIQQLVLNSSLETIVAVGMMVLMIAGVFDLSVGSVVGFTGACVAGLMVLGGVHPAVAVVAALVCAGLIGWFNGYLIAYVGINPLIQTLATLGMVRGATLMIAGAGIQNLPYEFIYLGQSKLLKIQAPIWWMIGVVVVFHYLTQYTTFFRRYYYIGGNEVSADLSGVHVKRMKLYGFVLSALLAGLAGLLLTARLGAAISTMGRGMELRVITAVILGGASLNGGQGKIIGALLGTLLISLISNVMILSRVSGYWQEIILGVILIAAIWFDLVMKKKAT